MTDSTALVARLRHLNSGVVSDVLDECGYPHQALSSTIRPVDPGMRLAGCAVCFSGESLDAKTPPAGKPLSTYDMDKRMVRDGIAVVATNGHAVSAVLGGLMCLSFSTLGCAGVVTDGGVRDAREIVELGLAAFTRYVIPMRSNGRWQLTEADQSVRLPGQEAAHVVIEPGDYLIGDEDGVMVIPATIAVQVIAWAEELARIEERIVLALKAGEPREKAFAAHPRFSHIGRLR